MLSSSRVPSRNFSIFFWNANNEISHVQLWGGIGLYLYAYWPIYSRNCNANDMTLNKSWNQIYVCMLFLCSVYVFALTSLVIFVLQQFFNSIAYLITKWNKSQVNTKDYVLSFSRQVTFETLLVSRQKLVCVFCVCILIFLY